MRRYKVRKKLILGIMSFALIIFFSSCNKNTKNTEEIIYYLKDLNSYSCNVNISIKNSKEEIKYSGKQFYHVKYGDRLDLGEDEIIFYKQNKIVSYKYNPELINLIEQPQEILNEDFKTFNISDIKVGVGQVQIMDSEEFKCIRQDVVDFMELKSSEEEFGLMILMVTDLLKEGSELIAVGSQKDIVSKAFGVNLIDNGTYVPGILSRKKQVIPPLTAAMSS